MNATLTIRSEGLPELEGSLVSNIFTHFHDDSKIISYDYLKELQDKKIPIDVLIVTEESQEEFQSLITLLTERTVQFLLFKD